ncbi:hypothetical protein Tsubulata_000817 [Turnera subulata]|uniref:ADP-ribosyl cyclase/cyclic ADP-ribose hydrolase n=1 Tax=Turnera subulata TaxID=218843 RepID=A0A9Q0G9K5_9ROSI|nr:hypothetical protein Tsubulata_000817 [Turnera subulata]
MERNPKKLKNNPAEQQASSSTSPYLPHDIFLSFRGPDIRNTFIDHLKRELGRAGYRVFFDEEGITLGKEIGSELPKAIQESRSSIVVLSHDYASSKWCLNELVTIMHRYKQDGHHVLPVFYHVHPSDVRHQRNSFANSFAKHQGACDEEIVNEWKESLAKIGGLKGIHVEEETKEAEVIQKIVKEIGGYIRGTATIAIKSLSLAISPFCRKCIAFLQLLRTITSNLLLG